MSLREIFGLAPRSEFQPGEVAVFVWGAGSDAAEPNPAYRNFGRARDGEEVEVVSRLHRCPVMRCEWAYEIRFRDCTPAKVAPTLLRKRRPDEDDSAEPRKVVNWDSCPWQPAKIGQAA